MALHVLLSACADMKMLMNMLAVTAVPFCNHPLVSSTLLAFLSDLPLT